ncbi:hypothetical protein [Curvivirga sp.]|uniref:hypothetical protein n=1 Tax=Curvivirga sp. TaxID=2856848 RepID=UPI003B5918AF
MRKTLMMLSMLLLSACLTTKEPHNVSMDELSNYRIAKIDVSIEEWIRWYGGQEQYAESIGCRATTSSVKPEDRQELKHTDDENSCDFASVVESPEAIAYMHGRLSDIMFETVEEVYADSLSGPIPATLKVNINRLDIIGTGQGILIGGNHRLVGSIELVDQKTGTLIISSTRFSVSVRHGGIGGIIASAIIGPIPNLLSEHFAQKSHHWLMGNSVIQL